MPLYEYQCPNCDHQIELIQKVTDVFDETCKNCSEAKMKKKLSLTSFQLKGGGWYKDGYGKPKSKEIANKEIAKKGVAKKEEAKLPAAKKTDIAKPPAAKTSAKK